MKEMKEYQKPRIDTTVIMLEDVILVSKNPEAVDFTEGVFDEIW